MPHARHERIAKLFDKSARASTALVVVLTLTWVTTALGLLSIQKQLGHRQGIIQTTSTVLSHLQSMRLAVGTWILRGDDASISDWYRLSRQAHATVASLSATALGDDAGESLVDAIDRRLRESIDTDAPLLSGTSPASRQQHVAEFMGPGYQARYAAMTAALAALSEHEQARLRRLRGQEELALAVAGLVLLVLVLWSIRTLRGSRKTTAAILQNLEDAFSETDQRRAELDAFTNAAPLAVFHADATGLPRWLNAKASAWVGGRHGDDAALYVRDGIAADDRQRVVDAWQRLLGSGEKFEQTFVFVGADGEATWMHANAAPVLVGAETTGLVIVVQDVTASRSLQDELTQSRTRMRRMADGVPALMARLDETETYRFVNATYRAWFGDSAPRIGSTLQQFLGEETYALFGPILARVRSGEGVRFEMRYANLHGHDFVGDVSYSPDHDEEGRFNGIYILVNDVSERKELEKGMFAAKELAQVTLESIADAVLTTDRFGMVTFLNPRAEALLDKPAVRVRGLPIDAVVELHDHDGHPSRTSLLRAIREERVVDAPQSRRLVLADGGRLDVEDVAAPIRDREGTVVGGVLVLRDVSVARAVAERMRQLAESDPLTGLPNRMAFEERLRTLLTRLAPDETLAVLYMDLDGFKAVNDLHGHAAGDELLRQFAERLVVLTAPADVVCRIGGDEFVALLAPPISVREAAVRADAFIDAATRPFVWQGQVLSVTLSVGVAEAPLHGTDTQTLVRKADDALYAAKDAGKNQVHVAR